MTSSRLISGFSPKVSKRSKIYLTQIHWAVQEVSVYMNLTAKNQWLCKSFDIKPVFQRSHSVDRNIFAAHLKRLKFFKVWKIKKTGYGLVDASRTWQFSIKKVPVNNKIFVCKNDFHIAICYYNEELQGVTCANIDNFIIGGTKLFIKNTFFHSVNKSSLYSQKQKSLKYLWLNM